MGGFRQVARDRADRLRVPLPALEARVEAADVAPGMDLPIQTDRIRGLDEGPLEIPVDVHPELAVEIVDE